MTRPELGSLGAAGARARAGTRKPSRARVSPAGGLMLLGVLAACSGGQRAEPVASAGAMSSGGMASGSGATSASAGSGGSDATGGKPSSGSGGQAVDSGGTNSGNPSGGNAQGGRAGNASLPITCRAKGDGKSTITLVNLCSQTLSFRGSDIEGGELASGEHACRDVGNATDTIPAIRFWGFIGEDPGGEKHTLAELTLNTDFNDFDWYNISHVDAHNLPLRVAAVDMDACRVLTCAESLLEGCPAEGQLKDGSANVISCVSPDRDNPNSPVAQYFEASCGDAYSWSGDDADSVVACAGEDYDVVFCP